MSPSFVIRVLCLAEIPRPAHLALAAVGGLVVNACLRLPDTAYAAAIRSPIAKVTVTFLEPAKAMASAIVQAVPSRDNRAVCATKTKVATTHTIRASAMPTAVIMLVA